MTTTAWAGLDPARRERFERAINVSGASSVLVQNFTNRIIQQLTLREQGAGSTLPRKPGSGSQAVVNRRSGSAMTASNVWVADTDSVTESTGAVAQATFSYATLATRGRVTRKMRAIGRSYVDILAEEMIAKADDYNESLESALFIGDSAAITNQIDGLLTLINAVSGQVVAQTSAVGGDDLSLAKLDEAIDVVKGAGNRADLMLYCSFLGSRKVNAALDSRQRFNDMIEISAGFRVRHYDGVPVIVSTGMGDDLTWSGTALTGLSGETTNPTTAIVVVNKRHFWIEELTPMTVMPLARDDSQYEQFDIFGDMALVQSNTLGGSILGGIAV